MSRETHPFWKVRKRGSHLFSPSFYLYNDSFHRNLTLPLTIINKTQVQGMQSLFVYVMGRHCFVLTVPRTLLILVERSHLSVSKEWTAMANKMLTLTYPEHHNQWILDDK
jgi:hypothetical protein